jgi:hypothetical protein
VKAPERWIWRGLAFLAAGAGVGIGRALEGGLGTLLYVGGLAVGFWVFFVYKPTRITGRS